MIDIVPLLKRLRAVVMISFDSTAWVLSYVLFSWLRYDTDAVSVPWMETLLVAIATALVYVAIGWATGLLRGRSTTASLDEMVLLGGSVLSVGFVISVINFFTHWLPRSVPPAAAIATLVLAAWARAVWRRQRERSDEDFARGAGSLALVVGAGEAGRELIGSMLRDPQRRWRPVGILDDDPRKRRLRIRSVPVLGTTGEVERWVRETQADALVIAIPSADAATVNRLRLAGADAEVRVKVLPSSTEMLTDHVGIRDIRDISIADVLGRHQLDTDMDAIAGYLSGRKVLVTGAGGSIGSELCRQIYRFAPSELMMLDRDESALHAVQLSIHGRALLDGDEVILCDIRDSAAVEAVFSARRPDVVFHAAALKHLPMLEQYPAEAVKTNVIGSRTVIDAADRAGVTTFVNISTDKAANPCSVLGYSKRIAEAVTADRSRRSRATCVSVRFGNVLGSRGSVLTSFAQQIADGGPLTVTDPEVTRYFMTIGEACQLVIQAAAIGGRGEALVLDMGEPVKILDMAHQLMEQAGSRVRVEFTGLRDGEKMHEELFGDGEPHDIRPRHPLVSHVPVPTISDEDVDSLLADESSTQVRRALAMMCAQLEDPRLLTAPSERAASSARP